MPKRLELTIGLVFPIVLMGWRVQEHQSKDIQVPHAIDASEKGTVHLHRDAAPLPMAFSHLWEKRVTFNWTQQETAPT